MQRLRIEKLEVKSSVCKEDKIEHLQVSLSELAMYKQICICEGNRRYVKLTLFWHVPQCSNSSICTQVTRSIQGNYFWID